MRFKDSKKPWLRNKQPRRKFKKIPSKKQRMLIKTLKMGKVAFQYLTGIRIQNTKV